MQLDGRQIEEVLLTATQTMMGVALILALRFHRNTAWALLALFAVQFPITSTAGRLILCGVYAALAIAGLIVNRRHLTATLKAPFDFDDGAPHDSSRKVETTNTTGQATPHIKCE